MDFVEGLAVIAVILFWVIKAVSVIILIASIFALVTACQHGTVGTFDFAPLIWSALGTLFL